MNIQTNEFLDEVVKECNLNEQICGQGRVFWRRSPSNHLGVLGSSFDTYTIYQKNGLFTKRKLAQFTKPKKYFSHFYRCEYTINAEESQKYLVEEIIDRILNKYRSSEKQPQPAN